MTPWTVAGQAPLSMGFSRQEYWSGLPLPFPGDLPNPGIKPRSPALQADSLPVGLGPWVWEECIAFLYTNASLPSLWTYGWGPQCSSPVQPQGRGDRGVTQAPPTAPDRSAAPRRWGAPRSRRRRRGPRGTHRPSLGAAGPARSHEAGDSRQGAGDSHPTRGGRPGIPEPWE